jgi:Flp pilus assembly protein TadG
MRITRSTERRRSAAAAVELAIFLPVLAVLVLGCIDFGRFAYSYIALTNAARSGSFYGVMNPYRTAGEAAWLSQIQTQAQNEMTNQTGYVSSNLTVDQTALTKTTASNGDTVYSNSDVVVTIEKTTGERRVSVTAHYPFKTIIVYPGLASNIGMKRLAVMRSIR